MGSNINVNIDEQQWIIQIRQMLEEEAEDVDQDVPVCIFSVPRTLRAKDPDSYTPQLVAIGPYHHNQLHLHELEKHKILSAKKTQKQLIENGEFQTLVDQLKSLEPRIRASYHKNLGVGGEKLSWMMAIDASFLLNFLQIYAANENRATRGVSNSPRLLHSFDDKRRKLSDKLILRDVVMMENQAPMFVLRKTMEFQFPTSEAADEALECMLINLCKDLSPFKTAEKLHEFHVSECFHILDLLFKIVVPRLQEHAAEKDDESEKDQGEEINENERLTRHTNLLTRLKEVLTRFMRKLLLSKPMKILLALPLIALCNLPALAILNDPVKTLISGNALESNNEATSPSSYDPLVEEIMIPSVTELCRSGIAFSPSDGGIESISFDTNTNKLHLPIVTIDVNSEVVLRNLIAYEASSSCGRLVLARYTEIMNGIIDTEEDARLLREKGVILNHLKSDEEVARLWNGMSKSLRLTRVGFLDQVIEEVNGYYSRSWKVKLVGFIEKYAHGSWQVLASLGVVFMFFMALELFISVFYFGGIGNKQQG